jgi:hypothetical protein
LLSNTPSDSLRVSTPKILDQRTESLAFFLNFSCSGQWFASFTCKYHVIIWKVPKQRRKGQWPMTGMNGRWVLWNLTTRYALVIDIPTESTAKTVWGFVSQVYGNTEAGQVFSVSHCSINS